jgi:hypothetical protein
MAQNATAPSVQPEADRLNDFLVREYLPVIRQFPEQEVQASLMHESVVTLVRTKDASQKPPSAPVSDHLPEPFRFLEGRMVDLGFGKLDLPQAEVERIFLEFCGQGVAVPGTPYRLRHSVMSLFTFVEPATGQEVILPPYWREVVRSESWIGKRVVPPNCDLSLYQDTGEGYLLRKEDSDG